jgi:hypothetical protein
VPRACAPPGQIALESPAPLGQSQAVEIQASTKNSSARPCSAGGYTSAPDRPKRKLPSSQERTLSSSYWETRITFPHSPPLMSPRIRVTVMEPGGQGTTAPPVRKSRSKKRVAEVSKRMTDDGAQHGAYCGPVANMRPNWGRSHTKRDPRADGRGNRPIGACSRPTPRGLVNDRSSPRRVGGRTQRIEARLLLIAE